MKTDRETLEHLAAMLGLNNSDSCDNEQLRAYLAARWKQTLLLATSERLRAAGLPQLQFGALTDAQVLVAADVFADLCDQGICQPSVYSS